jgi:hypothetical protein
MLSTTACNSSGEVVVVLDTTMRGDGVEVVAFRSDANESDASRGATAQRRTRTPLDDSVAMLDARFRAMRDSLNTEVARLDTADRRSRAYAVRYAEIRRRTIAAEQVRARRDSVRARVEGIVAGAGSGTSRSGASASLPSLANVANLQRHAVSDSSVVLDLAAGRWSIGAARDGRLVSEPVTLTIEAGTSDTVRVPAVVPPDAGALK